MMATVSASSGIGRETSTASAPQRRNIESTRPRSWGGSTRSRNGPPARPTANPAAAIPTRPTNESKSRRSTGSPRAGSEGDGKLRPGNGGSPPEGSARCGDVVGTEPARDSDLDMVRETARSPGPRPTGPRPWPPCPRGRRVAEPIAVSDRPGLPEGASTLRSGGV